MLYCLLMELNVIRQGYVWKMKIPQTHSLNMKTKTLSRHYQEHLNSNLLSSIYLYLVSFTHPRSVISMLHIFCCVTIYIRLFFNLHDLSTFYLCPPWAPVLTIHSPCLPDLPATTSPLTAPDIPLPSVQDLEKRNKKGKTQWVDKL